MGACCEAWMLRYSCSFSSLALGSGLGPNVSSVSAHSKAIVPPPVSYERKWRKCVSSPSVSAGWATKVFGRIEQSSDKLKDMEDQEDCDGSSLADDNEGKILIACN